MKKIKKYAAILKGKKETILEVFNTKEEAIIKLENHYKNNGWFIGWNKPKTQLEIKYGIIIIKEVKE